MSMCAASSHAFSFIEREAEGRLNEPTRNSFCLVADKRRYVN